MKTEKEYADELVDEYYLMTTKDDYYAMSEYMAIQCAINDVTNTIKVLIENGFNYNYPTVSYYQTVLQILKERL